MTRPTHLYIDGVAHQIVGEIESDTQGFKRVFVDHSTLPGRSCACHSVPAAVFRNQAVRTGGHVYSLHQGFRNDS